MEISAINKQYNVSTKSQYDTYPTETPYPAYVEEEPKNSSNMAGLMALGVLGLAGIGYGLYKHKSVADLTKQLKEKKTALEDVTTKLTESESKRDTAEKALAAANKKLEESEAAKTNKPTKTNIFKKTWEKFNNWRKGSVV